MIEIVEERRGRNTTTQSADELTTHFLSTGQLPAGALDHVLWSARTTEGVEVPIVPSPARQRWVGYEERRDWQALMDNRPIQRSSPSPQRSGNPSVATLVHAHHHAVNAERSPPKAPGVVLDFGDHILEHSAYLQWKREEYRRRMEAEATGNVFYPTAPPI